jgi:hypothetical protein
MSDAERLKTGRVGWSVAAGYCMVLAVCVEVVLFK